MGTMGEGWGGSGGRGNKALEPMPWFLLESSGLAGVNNSSGWLWAEGGTWLSSTYLPVLNCLGTDEVWERQSPQGRKVQMAIRKNENGKRHGQHTHPNTGLSSLSMKGG